MSSDKAPKFTLKEIIDGIREMYEDWRKFRCRDEGLSNIRLPDFEAAIAQLESTIPQALSAWKKYYEAELELCDREIARCQAENDSHGVNFYEGRKSGLINNDIGLSKLKSLL